MLKEGTLVNVALAVLEDQPVKSNHHLLERIIKEDRTGEVINVDTERSSKETFRYWVKFHYAKILLSDEYLTTPAVK